MPIPDYTAQFRRDLKKCEARNFNIKKLKTIITIILDGKKLQPIYKDHRLHGKWHHCKELHIESDWLLIYAIKDNICIFLSHRHPF